MFIILAEDLGGVHPCIYALLPDKSRNTYDRLFTMVNNLRPNMDPNAISIDFEQAAFQSIEQIFPNALIDGCYFHFTKNFRKQLSLHDLLGRYDNDQNFALMARMIPAMAFVPENDLDAAFTALTNFLPPEFAPLLQWLENSYLGRPVGPAVGPVGPNNQPQQQQQRRRAPLFPVSMWNVHNRVVAHVGRTNNYAEAAHRQVQLELKTTHPTTWKLMTDLQKVQKSRDTYHESLVAGHPPRKKLQKYINCDENILRIVRLYPNMVYLDFLRGIAHNYLLH